MDEFSAFATAGEHLATAFEAGDAKQVRVVLDQLRDLSGTPDEHNALVLAIHDEIKKANVGLLPMLTPLWDQLPASSRKHLKPVMRQAVLGGSAEAVISLLPYLKRHLARADWLSLAMGRNPWTPANLKVMAVLLPGTGDLKCADALLHAVQTFRPAAVNLLLTRTYTEAHLTEVMVQALRNSHENSHNGRQPDAEDGQVLQSLIPRVDLDAVANQMIAKKLGRQLGMLARLVAPTQMGSWLVRIQAQYGQLHPDLADAAAWVQAHERQMYLAQRPAAQEPGRRRHRA